MPNESREAVVEGAITKFFGGDARSAASQTGDRNASRTTSSDRRTAPPRAASDKGKRAPASAPAAARAQGDRPDPKRPEQRAPESDSETEGGESLLDAAVEGREGSGSEGDGEGDEGSGEADTASVERVRAANRALLDSGKISAALKAAFGDDVSIDFLKTDDAKFVALRKQRKDLSDAKEEAKSEILKELDKVNTAKAALQTEWAPFRELALTAQKGDVVGMVEALAKHAKVTPKELITAYVKGEKQIDRPLRQRVDELEQRTRQGAPQQRPAPQQGQQQPDPQKTQQAVAAAVTDLTTKLADHGVARIKNYGRKVLEVMQAEYRKSKTRLSPEEAAERVIEARRKELQEDSWLIEGGEQPRKAQAHVPTRTRRERLRPGSEEFTGTRQERVDAAITRFFGRAG